MLHNKQHFNCNRLFKVLQEAFSLATSHTGTSKLYFEWQCGQICLRRPINRCIGNSNIFLKWRLWEGPCSFPYMLWAGVLDWVRGVVCVTHPLPFFLCKVRLKTSAQGPLKSVQTTNIDYID